MKEYYMVGVIKKEMMVKVANAEVPLKLSWADGMIGTIPIFTDIESAIKYRGNTDAKILSLTAQNTEATDGSTNK